VTAGKSKLLVLPLCRNITNEAGRIARPGQEDTSPEWTIIECSEESFDAVSIARRERGIDEKAAIMEIEEALERRGELARPMGKVTICID
jgi:hypothetical protein